MAGGGFRCLPRCDTACGGCLPQLEKRCVLVSCSDYMGETKLFGNASAVGAYMEDKVGIWTFCINFL